MILDLTIGLRKNVPEKSIPELIAKIRKG